MNEQKQIIRSIEKMAENGQPPVDNCVLFNVGYRDALDRLENVYLKDIIMEGDSAEKFIFGTYGSGKSLLLRTILEIGRNNGYISAEVLLNKEVDYTQPLLVYKEIVRGLRMPDNNNQGLKALLIDAFIKNEKELADESDRTMFDLWIDNIDQSNFDHPRFAAVVRKAMLAYQDGGMRSEEFDNACRWLSGEFTDATICKSVGESRITSKELPTHVRRCLNSLFQFIKYSTYLGTLIGYDEAEQGLNVQKKKKQIILSMLQSGINNLSKLEKGSAFIIFALTPELEDDFMEFDALKQRIDDPIPGRGFFEGDTLAPKINLGFRGSAEEHLNEIAQNLVTLFYDNIGKDISVPKKDVEARAQSISKEVASGASSANARRILTRSICKVLSHLGRTGELLDADIIQKVKDDEYNADDIE